MPEPAFGDSLPEDVSADRKPATAKGQGMIRGWLDEPSMEAMSGDAFLLGQKSWALP
jgi:hypothetical protein